MKIIIGNIKLSRKTIYLTFINKLDTIKKHLHINIAFVCKGIDMLRKREYPEVSEEIRKAWIFIILHKDVDQVSKPI